MCSGRVEMKLVVVLLLCVCYFFGAGVCCPPDGFDSVAPFSIEKYIRHSWYVQEQMPVSYQPEDSLFCVVATYQLKNPKSVTDGIRVLNYANNKEVNGEARGTSGSGFSFGELQAVVPDLMEPSKLRVGPTILESIFGSFSEKLYGDYWVVDVGPNDESPEVDYEWAIVSGGPPRVESENGCRTGWEFSSRFQTNGVGLWLFSRKPEDPENTEMMRQRAQELGFDLSVLKPVQQNGCLYEGAILK